MQSLLQLNMRFKLILVILLINLTATICGKTGYNLTINALQFPSTDVYLACHLNGKVYISDTIHLDKKGKGISSGEKKLEQGLYLIYINKTRNYPFLIAEKQHMTLEIDTLNKVDEFEITGALESTAFDYYMQFLTQKSNERAQISSMLKQENADTLSKIKWQEKLDILEDKVRKEQLKLSDAFKNKALGIFIRGSLEIEIPDAYKVNDQYDKKPTWWYYKSHYWDNIPLSDERIWRFNFMTQKLDYFMKHVLYQDVDSILPEAINLIGKSRGGDPMAFRIMVSNMLNYASTSNIMGMDKLYDRIAQEYYLSGLANWADTTLLNSIRAVVEKNKYNLIGLQAQNLHYFNELGEIPNLYDLNSTYTILYFFEPNCGHCKSTTPLLANVFQKYKNRGLKVLAFYTLTDEKEWIEFRQKYLPQDFNHGWDPARTSNYWKYFDTSVTPAMYLLDRNKIIIAKKIDIPTLDRLLETLLK